MNTATPLSRSVERLPSRDVAERSVWNELVDAMPIMILLRALRDIRRQQAHRQAVLRAFRR